jgi:hypothetical protein
MTKETFGLPTNSFLICYPSRPELVTQEQMYMWLQLIIKVGDESSLILIPRTSGRIHALDCAIHQLQEEEGGFDEKRVIVLQMEEHGREYMNLLRQMDLFIDSCEGCLTSAAGKPVLCMNNFKSDILSRAASKHMKAVGLSMFIAETTGSYFEKGVKVAKDKQLLMEIAFYISQKHMWFEKHWTNIFQKALLSGIEQFKTGNGSRLQDIDVKSSCTSEEFQDSKAIQRKKLMQTIRQLTKKTLDAAEEAFMLIMKNVQRKGNTLVDVVGVGGGTAVVKCKQNSNNDREFVLKMDLVGSLLENVTESGCFRSSFNGGLSSEKNVKKGSRNVFPQHVNIFKDNSAFCGHTNPDSNGLVHFFLCCDYVDCDSLARDVNTFKDQWKQHGIISEQFRLFTLRYLETIRLSHSHGLSILDVKPKNFGYDKHGNITPIDLGFSVVFSFGFERLGFPSAPPVLSLRNSKGRARHSIGGLRGYQEDNTVVFSIDDLERFRLKLLEKKEELSCLGIGTPTYYDESDSGLRKNRKDHHITPSNAHTEDTIQALMGILHMFRAPKSGEDYAKVIGDATACKEAMMKFITPEKCAVKQKSVSYRWANLFCHALGRDRICLEKVLHDVALLLIVLKPELDSLACGDGILFPGGCVNELPGAAKKVEAWKLLRVIPIRLKYLGESGLSVHAVENVPPKTFIGFYVGKYIKDIFSMEGRHSRYVATILGVKRGYGDWISSSRFYCDAAPDEELTMEWYMQNNVYCHFMNSESAINANCILDRYHAWVIDSLLWIPMYSADKEIAAGAPLCWNYKHGGASAT